MVVLEKVEKECVERRRPDIYIYPYRRNPTITILQNCSIFQRWVNLNPLYPTITIMPLKLEHMEQFDDQNGYLISDIVYIQIY